MRAKLLKTYSWRSHRHGTQWTNEGRTTEEAIGSLVEEKIGKQGEVKAGKRGVRI